MASTPEKDVTSVGTPWFYTSVSTSSPGYTAAPDHQYTTTRIQVHATLDLLSDENTTYVIPTSDPTTVWFARSDIPLVDNAGDKELIISALPDVSVPVTFTAEVAVTTTTPTPKKVTLTVATSGTPQESSTTITTITESAKMTRRPKKVDETSESNAIDIPYQTMPLDNEFPQNNIISRRGFVFLHERTRNKRIQELLEEKRNLLMRMKRAQGI